MTIARRALPELLGRPRVLGAGVLQFHLGAAPLATDTDVGVVHGEIVVCRPGGSQHQSRAGRPTMGREGPVQSRITCTRSAPWLRPARGRARD